MSIRSKLEALKANFGLEDPARTSTDLQRTMERLIAEEERNRPLKVGDIAPVFTLPDSNDVLVSSADLLQKGPLIVTFYRGLWCPYCQRDLKGFQDAMSDIRSAKASVIAISHQLSSHNSRRFQQDNNIRFPVLEDDTGHVAIQFGIRWTPDDLRFIEKCLGTDLVVFRGTEPWIVPMQARYVIARNSAIAFAEVAFDYTQRSEPAQVLLVLDRLDGTA